MKTALKIIVSIFSLIGLAYIALIVFINIGGLTDSNCTEHQEKRVSSPSKNYAVSYVQEICAPNNNLNAHVMVMDKEIKNASIVLKATSTSPILNLDFIWRDDSTLIIKYPKRPDVTYTYFNIREKIVNVIFKEKIR